MENLSGVEKKIIYDFGANNGGDIPYYLKKADLVVAVEANPSLCWSMEKRFATAIEEGRLRIENCVLVGEGNKPVVNFYLHRRRDVLSQFPRPDASVIGNFNRVALPSQSVMQLLQKYGAPYYIKIDTKNYGEVILRELFQNGIKPPFISAESRSIKVLSLLVGMAEYSSFKLVEGATVAEEYRNHVILVDGSREVYSFPPQSAGPFGEDIRGEWMNADDLFDVLAEKKLGWRDIHATNLVQTNQISRAQRGQYMRRHSFGWVRAKIRSMRSRRAGQTQIGRV